MNIRRFTVNELITDLDLVVDQLSQLEKLDLASLEPSQLDILESDVKANFITLRSIERNPRFHNHTLEQSTLTELLNRYRTFANKLDNFDASVDSKPFTARQFYNFERTMGKVGTVVLESCFSVEREHNTHNLHFDFPDKLYKVLAENTSTPILLHVFKENQSKFHELNYPQADLMTKYLETLCSKTKDRKTIDLAASSLAKLKEMSDKKLFCSDKEMKVAVSESVEDFEADFKGFLV